MRRLSVLATTVTMALVAMPGGASPRAAPLEPYATRDGWTVERRVDRPGSFSSCRMSRTMRDVRGETASVVIVSREGTNLSLALADRDWDFATDERLVVPLLFDSKRSVRNPIWTGDGQVLRTVLPDSSLPDLQAARTVILRFADGDVAFAIPDFAAGYDALQRCDTASLQPPALMAAPGLPPRARLAAYTIGMALERVLRDCPVSATEGQRAAVRARMAALRPELSPYEDAIRGEVTKSGGVACPDATKEPAFQEAMRRFITLTPEDLSTAIDRQVHGEASVPAGTP